MNNKIDKSLDFEWDEGNSDKSLRKHGVTDLEAEEVFFDKRKQDYSDPVHSRHEERKVVVGKTKLGRLLFIAYTARNGKIRIISARDLNQRKESDLYEEAA